MKYERVLVTGAAGKLGQAILHDMAGKAHLTGFDLRAGAGDIDESACGRVALGSQHRAGQAAGAAQHANAGRLGLAQRGVHHVVVTVLGAAAGKADLAGVVARETGQDVKVFVDTAPLMEKPLAERAGIGWQGKHTNLVSRDLGSWFFLGVILTAAEIEADVAETDHCGSCRACLDTCPTAAFPAPYQLDARRCLSYLTIEHAGPWPEDLRRAMGNRVYGCDDCLAACPWNKFAQSASEIRLQARDELKAPRLDEMASLDDAGFRALFRKSAVKRIGRDRFVRNVLYAIGNSGDAMLRPSAQACLDDPDPGVRDAARWALDRLEAA